MVDTNKRMSLNDIINHPLMRIKKASIMINPDRKIDSY